MLMTVMESDPATQGFITLFQRRLAELGWVEDRNVRFNRRWAAGSPERIRANVIEIVGLRPDVIVAQNTPMVAILHKETDRIPIVFVQVSDPIGDGFVETLARPGGNVTGFTNTMSTLGSKWLELLREAAPGLSRVGFLLNRAASPGGGAYYLGPFEAAAKSLGLTAVLLEPRNEGEIDPAISDFAAAGGDGIVANSDSFISVNRDRIIAAVNQHRLPTIYSSAIFAYSGGFLSYGADTAQQWQAAAGYVDRILRGSNPRELPVQLPTKFELVINSKTAKALGVTIPQTLLARADEVIE
jgi:putative ABC transport system substrate-binding protein